MSHSSRLVLGRNLSCQYADLWVSEQVMYLAAYGGTYISIGVTYLWDISY